MKKGAIVLICSLFMALHVVGADEASARLLLDSDITGRLSFRDKSGLLVTEIVKSTEKQLELGLEPGYYEIILQKGDAFYRAEVTLPATKTTSLAMAHFKLLNGSQQPPAVVPSQGPAKSEGKTDNSSSWSFHPTIWFDGLEFINFGFKTGPKYVYLTGNFSYSPGVYDKESIWADPVTYRSNDLIAYRGGLGFEIPLGPFFVDIEGLAGLITDLDSLDKSSFEDSSSLIVQGRIVYGVKFAKHFGIYFGFSYDYIRALTGRSPMPQDVNMSFLDYSDPQNVHRIGGFMGIQF